MHEPIQIKVLRYLWRRSGNHRTLLLSPCHSLFHMNLISNHDSPKGLNEEASVLWHDWTMLLIGYYQLSTARHASSCFLVFGDPPWKWAMFRVTYLQGCDHCVSEFYRGVSDSHLVPYSWCLEFLQTLETEKCFCIYVSVIVEIMLP